LKATLYYIADPMCSWCWAFANVFGPVEQRLRPEVSVRLVLGGLAPDDDAPMDDASRSYIRSAWRTIEERTGTRFNHSFWEACTPRRSTWPACRAVLAAGERGREMFAAIQRAYYEEARDPSERATLVALGVELGFDDGSFAEAIDAPETRRQLAEDFALRDRFGVSGFPSLALERGEERGLLTSGWLDAPALEELLVGLDLLVR